MAFVDEFTSTTTWTCPVGVYLVAAECWGGGGAGGGVTTTAGGAGGAAGGAYSMRGSIPVTPGNTYTVTVAATRVGTSAGNGSDGNDSSFVGDNGVNCLAKGGAGGLSNANGGTGGVGTTAGSVGDLIYPGGNGGSGNGTNGAAGGGAAGSTGAGTAGTATVAGVSATINPFKAGNAGSGSATQTATNNGFNGNSYGGGGGGALNLTTTARTGGTGAAGYVRLVYSAGAAGRFPVVESVGGEVFAQPSTARKVPFYTRTTAGLRSTPSALTVNYVPDNGGANQTLTTTSIGTGAYTVDLAALTVSNGQTGRIAVTATTDATETTTVAFVRFDNTVSSRHASGAAVASVSGNVGGSVASVTNPVRLAKSVTAAGEQLALAVSDDRGTASIGRVIESAAPALPTGTIVYDPTVGVTRDGNGRVSQWLDTSGTYAATQADAAKRPALDGDGNEARVVFDGTRDDFLTLPNTLTTTANNYSLFAIVEQFDPTQSQFAGLGGGNSTGYAGSLGSGFSGSPTTLIFDGGPASSSLYSTPRETLVGVVSRSTGRTVYVESASETIGASGSQTVQGGTLGNVFYGDSNPAWAFTGAIRLLVKVDHAVSDAERQQIVDYLDWRLRVPATASVAAVKPVNVVCTGDSITYGLSSGTMYGWPSMLGHARRDASIVNLGVSGRTLADIAANAAAEIDTLLREDAVNVLYAWATTNDLQAGTTPATAYATYQAFTAARFAAGWDYVIVLDVLARADSSATAIDQFNALMAAGASTWASAFIPISQDARFAAAGNTIYFADGIHPTIAGNRVILRYALDALDSLVAPVQPNVIDPDEIVSAINTVGVVLTDDYNAAKTAAQASAVEALDTKADQILEGQGDVEVDINAIASASANAVWANERRDLTDGKIVQQPSTQSRQREIVKGDTYDADNRQMIVQASDGGQWPATLNGRTWYCRLTKIAANRQTGTSTLTTPCTVLSASGPTQSLRINLSGAQTTALANGQYDYAVYGEDGSGDVWTVERGRFTAIEAAGVTV